MAEAESATDENPDLRNVSPSIDGNVGAYFAGPHEQEYEFRNKATHIDTHAVTGYFITSSQMMAGDN